MLLLLASSRIFEFLITKSYFELFQVKLMFFSFMCLMNTRVNVDRYS